MNNTINLKIEGMHCAACVTTVEKALSKVEGVDRAVVNLTLEKATIEGNSAPDKLITAVEKTGYSARWIKSHEKAAEENDLSLQTEKRLKAAGLKMWTAWAITGLIMLLMLPEMLWGIMWPTKDMHNLLMVLMSSAVIFGPGRATMKSAWSSALHLNPNMDVLIALGSLAALSTGIMLFFNIPIQSFAGIAGMILAFHLTGRYIETRARGKSSAAIRELMTLGAKRARIEDTSGKTLEIPVKNLKVGHMMLVRAGEKIPTDGIIIEGTAAVDESLATGESRPVIKNPKDKVLGATINLDGNLKIEATKVGADTFLSQMAKLVEEAQTTKVPIQIFADRMTAIFVPIVLGVAALTFAAWIIFGDYMQAGALYLGKFLPWVDLSMSPGALALFAAIAVLVIACPCALGLATPTALMAGTGKGAKNGILIRNGAAIQRLNDTTAVVFDKTGTLTMGKPVVKEVVSFGSLMNADLIRMAASLESQSNHPLAQAIVDLAEGKQISLDKVESVQTLPGRGIKAKYGTSALILGNSSATGYAGNFERPGSVIFLALDGKVEGAFVLEDEIRKEAVAAIAGLRARGLKCIMLTGDKKSEAERISSILGFDHFRAEVLPGQKSQIIKDFQEGGEIVCMVGDGINDAPALAQADIGIAMGTGTEIAMESGDIVLVGGNLEKLPQVLVLAQKTFQKIRQNLFWASIYNLVAIPLAIMGVLHPILAEAAMALSSINVVLNSNRLRKLKLG